MFGPQGVKPTVPVIKHQMLCAQTLCSIPPPVKLMRVKSDLRSVLPH